MAPSSRNDGADGAFDFREDGSYRMRLTYDEESGGTGKSSADADEVDAEDPRFSGAMKVIWTFTPVPAGTEVSVRCEDVPEGIGPEDHAAGLTSTLENLARFTE